MPAVQADFYETYFNAREIIDLGKRTFHEKEFEVKKGETNMLIENVVDQHKVKNTGHTVLSVRDSASDEPVAINPGEELLMNTPTGKIIVTNRDANKIGKITVVVYKRDAFER